MESSWIPPSDWWQQQMILQPIGMQMEPTQIQIHSPEKRGVKIRQSDQ